MDEYSHFPCLAVTNLHLPLPTCVDFSAGEETPRCTAEEQTEQTIADRWPPSAGDSSASNDTSIVSVQPADDIAKVQMATRARAWSMRARAHLTQTALFTWQELRERIFRIVRSKGAPEATLDEKAVPRMHPNVLLLLTLDGVDTLWRRPIGGARVPDSRARCLHGWWPARSRPDRTPQLPRARRSGETFDAAGQAECASTLREREMTRRKWLPSVRAWSAVSDALCSTLAA